MLDLPGFEKPGFTDVEFRPIDAAAHMETFRGGGLRHPLGMALFNEPRRGALGDVAIIFRGDFML